MNAYEKLVCCIPELTSAADGSGTTGDSRDQKEQSKGDPRWREGHLMEKCPISAVDSVFLVLIYR